MTHYNNILDEIRTRLSAEEIRYIFCDGLAYDTFYVEEIKPWMREYSNGWSPINFNKLWFTWKEN